MVEESDADWEARMMGLLDEAGAPAHDGQRFLTLQERMAALTAMKDRLNEQLKVYEAELIHRGHSVPAGT